MLVISAIKEGEILIQYDEKVTSLLPGSLAIFNPYENHKTESLVVNSKDYYTIYFDLTWCESIQRELFKTNFFLELDTSIIKDTLLTEKFLSLFDTRNEKDVEVFIKEIFTDYCYVTEKQSLKESKALKKIKTLLKEMDYKELSVELLAQHADISSNYLIKLFKKEYGLSPYAYILNQKIYKSKALLEEHMSIAEVAIELGFFDQSHFNKAFKSVYALTPKEFLENSQKG